MHSESYEFDGIEFTIKVASEGGRYGAQESDWRITAVDSSNAQYANVRIKASVLTFLAKTQNIDEKDLMMEI